MARRMKLGTRLTVMVLAYLASLGIALTVAAGDGAAMNFGQDLKTDACIAQRALNASLAPNMEQGNWDLVRYTMSVVGRKDVLGVLFDQHGLAGDSTMLHKDCYRPIPPSLINFGFLLAGSMGILLLARRYMTRSLVGLNARRRSLSATGAIKRVLDGKVELVPENCEGTNEQLVETRDSLFRASERKWRREGRKVNADKRAAIATLASAFAHEIGTPLGVIRGCAEMVLSSTFDEAEVTENLEIIISQIDRITRLVTILLNFARVRPAIRVASDVRAIAQRAIQLIQPEAVRHGVEVNTNFGSLPLMVDCDPDQLQQVFVNLELNALDAMGPNGGKLWVNSVSDEVDGRVRLSFQDSGPGVPTEIRDRIFDPFFTTKNTNQADGMGLAVSQSVIRDHDGELTLEQCTHGACFVVSLPAAGALELEPHI
jgi:signal transduction histidine kinase